MCCLKRAKYILAPKNWARGKLGGKSAPVSHNADWVDEGIIALCLCLQWCVHTRTPALPVIFHKIGSWLASDWHQMGCEIACGSRVHVRTRAPTPASRIWCGCQRDDGSASRRAHMPHSSSSDGAQLGRGACQILQSDCSSVSRLLSKGPVLHKSISESPASHLNSRWRVTSSTSCSNWLKEWPPRLLGRLC